MNVAEQVAHAVALLTAAVGIAAIAHWGRSNAAALVPAHLDAEDRERRVRTLVRGSVACYAAAAAVAVAAVLAVL